MSDAETITILVLFSAIRFAIPNIIISSTSVENQKKSSPTYFRVPALWNEESLNGFVEYCDDS